MWCIVTKKIGRVAAKEQGKSGNLLFNRSLAIAVDLRLSGCYNPNSKMESSANLFFLPFV
jgi:hypothetical protein